MKTKYKVRLFANWATSADITKRLLQQFDVGGSYSETIDFVYGDDYDIGIYYNYITEIANPDARRYVLPQEPYWSGSHVKSFADDGTTYFVYDKTKYETSNNVIERCATTFYGGRGPTSEGDDWSVDNITNKYNTTNKTKNISSVISTWGMDSKNNNPPTCTYDDRCDIMEYILASDIDIDVFGGWGRFYGNDARICDSGRKLDSVLPYRFQLVIENEYSKNWVTEKFYDAVLCDTIPIYYGCLNIDEIYDGGYILLDDPKPETVDRCLHDILQNPDTLYSEMIGDLRKLKKKYLENNMLTLIMSICDGSE